MSETLAGALQTDVTPLPISNAAARAPTSERQFSPNLSGMMAAGMDFAKAQGAQDVAGAKGMVEAAEQKSVTDHAAVAQAKADTKPIPAFVPTKENAADLSMIFGMLGVIGTGLGGKGKMAGMDAMSAMTGMMTGYQQGRQDLYEKEYKQFQANLETIKTHNETIQRELQHALKLSETDLEKGKAYAQLAMAQLDASVLGAKVKYEGVSKAAEWGHQMAMESMRMAKQAAAEDARHTRDLADKKAEEQRRHAETIAEEDRKVIDVSIDGRMVKRTVGQVRALMAQGVEVNPVNAAKETVTPIAQTVDGKQLTVLLHKTPEGATYVTYMDGTPVDPETAASVMSPQRTAASRQQDVSDDSLDQTAAGIASGAVRPPATTNRFRNEIMNRVLKMNPGYNEGDFGNRAMAERHWIDPNGQGGKQLMAFNTVAQHITTYEELAKALDNSDIQAQNRLLNYVNVQMGYPEVTNLNAARQAISAEIVKAITGVAGARADRSEAEGTLSSALSPAQMEGAVQTLRRLIGGRFESSLALYKAGTGKTEENFFKLLSPEALSVFRPQSTGAPSAAQPADMPRPKNRGEFDALPPGTKFISPDGSVHTKK